MDGTSKSYRRILFSSFITGGSSVINILIGIFRTKVIAVLLGPVGIGLIGIYQSFIATSATMAGLGISTAASRQIAEINGGGNQKTLSITIQALFLGTGFLSISGGIFVWICREPISIYILGDKTFSHAVGWLAVAVFLSVISATQMAIIQGLRQIKDLATLVVLSAFLGAVIGLALIWQYGQNGLLASIVAVPAASVCVGFYFVRKNLRLPKLRFDISSTTTSLSVMVKLGISLFVYTLLEQITFLLIRANIGESLGVAQLGYFQASWAIAVTYLGVITGAMSSDFMPRIAEKTGNNRAINELINHQAEVALLIAGPVIILMIGFSPMILSIMYSSKFTESSALFRLLLLSDIIKLVSWPIGFALLGMGDSAAFIRQGPVLLALLFLFFYLLLPYAGILSIGFAAIIMQAIGFIWVQRYINIKTGFFYNNKNKALFIIFGSFITATYFLCFYSEHIGRIVATCIALILIIFSYLDIKRKL